MHFKNDVECDSFINAHSISEKNQLALIAENGHVLRFSGDYSILTKYKGRPMPKEIGIGKASTFVGFCHAHDCSTFAEIDTQPLEPNKKMMALYAYRSLCRAYFAKENAVDLMRSMARRPELDSKNAEICDLSANGHEIGLKSIQPHKHEYENAILTQSFENFRYVLFQSTSAMDLQLAGVLYPEYDFFGDVLQLLGIQSAKYELISFFSAPMSTGWGFCFAWHKSSDSKCVHFIKS